jgi:aspartate kinase
MLSTGEQVSCALLASALRNLGIKAKSYMGYQVRIITDNIYSNARIVKVETDKLLSDIENGVVPVVAGFQGVTESGDITTLGRGGSDTTAVALAGALKADVCEIYTDVEGVFTADPNIVSNARKMEYISYEEMMEIASLGAKVLQIRSVEEGALRKVPIHVRSSFTESEGTFVLPENEVLKRQRKEGKSMEVVTSATYDRNQAKITILGVPDRPGIAAALFGAIGDEGISVDMIVQNVSTEGLTDITFTVPRTVLKKSLEIAKKVSNEIGAKGVTYDDKIAKVSIVGVGMRDHAGVAGKMFRTLAKEGINIQMISTSEIKISCVIEEKYTELATRVLHEAFGLGKG